MNYRRLCDAPEVSFEELTRRPFDGPIRCLKCRTEALFAAPAEADTANWDVAPSSRSNQSARTATSVHGRWSSSSSDKAD